MSEWTEYRAVFQRPASYLDKEYTGKGQAYVTEHTGGYRTREEARRAATFRSAETYASVTGYETRQVTATDWEEEPQP